MSYEFLKNKWYEHKPKLIIGLALTVSFICGYGTSLAGNNALPTDRRQINYTTNKVVPPSKETENPTIIATPTVKQISECKIKGNIGSGGKKTYHVPGGAFYDRTNAEICFESEQEAIKAGFVKSSR